MKRQILTILLISLPGLIQAQEECTKGGHCEALGKARSVSTLSGKILRKSSDECGGEDYQRKFSPLCVVIETTDGGEARLKLGHERFVHPEKLVEGSTASFQVFERRRGNKEVLVVKSFTVNGETFTLRDESGQPLWKDSFKGSAGAAGAATSGRALREKLKR